MFFRLCKTDYSGLRSRDQDQPLQKTTLMHCIRKLGLGAVATAYLGNGCCVSMRS